MSTLGWALLTAGGTVALIDLVLASATIGRLLPRVARDRAGAVRGPLAWLLTALIRGYQLTISPLIGPCCRFHPTCSHYGIEAIETHGALRGSWLTVKRIARCQPWGTSGLDFEPQRMRDDARWWLPWRYGLWRGSNAEPPAVSG